MMPQHDDFVQFVHRGSNVKRGVLAVHHIFRHVDGHVLVPHARDVKRVPQRSRYVKKAVVVGIGALQGVHVDHVGALHRFFGIQIDDASAYGLFALLRCCVERDGQQTKEQQSGKRLAGYGKIIHRGERNSTVRYCALRRTTAYDVRRQGFEPLSRKERRPGVTVGTN